MKKLLSAILLALTVLTTQELFHFNGIPHYETITPECRRVRDDLRLNGFYNIDTELRQLKEKLK